MKPQPDIERYLKQHIKTSLVGRELHYLESVTSTQDVARDLAEKGSPEGTVVIAGTQKAGRGRLGRTWFSPEGSLALSVILKPSTDEMRFLPAVSSLSVFHAINRLGVPAQIKWPNDVLIKGKKVCGILIESRPQAGDFHCAIVGIGINVSFDIRKYPEIAELATSISAHSSREVSVNEVIINLIDELERHYQKIADTDSLRSEWLANMDTIGRRIRVNMNGNIEDGVAETINRAGNLVLRRDDGTDLEIVAGDVTIVKD
ncbi:MAG: biotin--[acetyl-CoA-carboxylase] ligase [Dehalococcoidia bacterium]|nr:biotin--[acetyl-CoA-carboxylase] ligase [Dehalococcoidia bacterium]MDD5493400.1 biotin--[acetyl-CoA-carboxylase] ligase [Dehalococcoidia bacterium]